MIISLAAEEDMIKECSSVAAVIWDSSVMPSGWQDIDYGADLERMNSEQVGNP